MPPARSGIGKRIHYARNASITNIVFPDSQLPLLNPVPVYTGGKLKTSILFSIPSF